MKVRYVKYSQPSEEISATQSRDIMNIVLMHHGFSVHGVASFSTLFLNCKPEWKILGLYLKLWTVSSVSKRYNLSFIHC